MSAPLELDFTPIVAMVQRAIETAPSRPLALNVKDAARALGMSEDYFKAKVAPDLRIYRDGRMKLVPVRELERWLEENIAYALGDR